ASRAPASRAGRVRGSAGGRRSARRCLTTIAVATSREETLRSKRIRSWAAFALGCFGLLAAGATSAQSPTLDAITKRGELLCSGATVNSPGFAVVDAKGEWKGLDIDVCRALAVAILGDDKKMKLVPVSFVQRFPALQSSQIDVIAKNTAMNLTRTTDLGF